MFEPELETIVKKGWLNSCSNDIMDKIKSCAIEMNTYGGKLRTKFQSLIEEYMQQFETLRNSYDEAPDERYKETSNKLNNLIAQEEAYWKQRVKTFWLKSRNIN